MAGHYTQSSDNGFTPCDLFICVQDFISLNHVTRQVHPVSERNTSTRQLRKNDVSGIISVLLLSTGSWYIGVCTLQRLDGSIVSSAAVAAAAANGHQVFVSDVID